MALVAVPATAALLFGVANAGKYIWSYATTLPPDSMYDVVVDIDNVLHIGEQGWSIEMKADTVDSISATGLPVGVIGLYNRGKTWLINSLFQTHFTSSKMHHTRGLSMVCPPQHYGQNLVIFDTAGSDKAVPSQDYLAKKVTESFLRELVVHLSSVLIMVVNRLRMSDQAYLQDVMKLVRATGRPIRIILIHNLNDVELVEDVENIIKDEIINCYGGKEHIMPLVGSNEKATCTYYVSHLQQALDQRRPSSSSSSTPTEQTADQLSAAQVLQPRHRKNEVETLEHFIIARDSTKAGAKWNEPTFAALRSILQGAGNAKRDLQFMTEIVTYCNRRLPTLLSREQERTENSNGQAERLGDIAVHVHQSRPVIVLKQNASAEDDTPPKPVRLKISTNIGVSDGGRILGGAMSGSGSWVPLYTMRQFEKNYVISVDLCGISDEDVEVSLVHERLTVTGKNGAKRQFLCPKDPWAEYENQIPEGTFALEIDIPTRVTPIGLEATQVDGLLEISIPKDLGEPETVKVKPSSRKKAVAHRDSDD